MPAININLADVESGWEDLPEGKYLGEISAFKYREASDEGKSDQLMITYTVIDGDLTGKTSSQFQSLSDKSYGFVKRYFNKFGFTDDDYRQEGFLDYDEDTMEMLSPDIIGTQVIFQVKLDKKADRMRTELVSVEDEPPAQAAPVRRAAPPKAQAEPEPEETEAEPEEAPAPRRPAARPAAPAAKTQRRSLR